MGWEILAAEPHYLTGNFDIVFSIKEGGFGFRKEYAASQKHK
jgi:hypothetical protein